MKGLSLVDTLLFWHMCGVATWIDPYSYQVLRRYNYLTDSVIRLLIKVNMKTKLFHKYRLDIICGPTMDSTVSCFPLKFLSRSIRHA